MVKTHGVSPRGGSRDGIAWSEIGPEWFRTHLAILTRAEAAANRSERTEGLSHLGVNTVLARISRAKNEGDSDTIPEWTIIQLLPSVLRAAVLTW